MILLSSINCSLIAFVLSTAHITIVVLFATHKGKRYNLLRELGIVLIFFSMLTMATSQSLQSPSMTVFPDSFILNLHGHEREVDSFKIANHGNDTLQYALSTQYVDTYIYGRSGSGYPSTQEMTDSLVRGTILYATESLLMREFTFAFSGNSTVHVEFFIFESDSETGTYKKIFSRTVLFDSLPPVSWISSGRVNAEVDSGKYYIIGVSWDNPLTYAASISGCCGGNSGPSLDYKGSFVRAHSYPSDTAYSISAIEDNGIAYSMDVWIEYPLFLRILSGSSGQLAPAETTAVKFEIRTGAEYRALLSYVDIQSNDPTNSLTHVVIYRPFLDVNDVRPSLEGAGPAQFLLKQNFPNPFNPVTTISFSIPKQSIVTLEIFNLLGQKVATLLSGERLPGAYNVEWDASAQTSGVYYYRLVTDSYVDTKKLLLVR
jgi:hypothetical protein